jgi:hypothetical protein
VCTCCFGVCDGWHTSAVGAVVWMGDGDPGYVKTVLVRPKLRPDVDIVLPRETLNAPTGRTIVATGETRGNDLYGFAPEGRRRADCQTCLQLLFHIAFSTTSREAVLSKALRSRFLCPSGAERMTITSTGFAALHPWLQPAAPPGPLWPFRAKKRHRQLARTPTLSWPALRAGHPWCGK